MDNPVQKPLLRTIFEPVVGAIGLLLIASTAYMLFMGTTLPWVHSLFMNRTHGVVISAGIRSIEITGSSGGIPYVSSGQHSPKIEFAYAVNDKKYIGDRFDLSGKTYSLSEAQLVSEQYKPGQSISVWYSALDHHYAVIDPHPSYLKSLFGFLLPVVIALAIWKIFVFDKRYLPTRRSA